MSGRADWDELRARRLAEPGAADAYEAARLAFELGRSVRQLREQQGWSQTELEPDRAGAGSGDDPVSGGPVRGRGTVPTLHVLERLARALGVELAVSFSPKAAAA